MRTRLTQIAQILQLDLSTFDGRARAWAALRATSREKAETPPLISPRLGTLDA
ncbi:DNA-binding PucR family transcriptional regulator [Microbacterium amylolyticum]|uniref:DNA-binding PucR family transcriptional regulator n=2 Tax=Microbacterium amylolyticum TaxID=936337 RepID=A0ABS4ZIN1_9MICO|nr:DNA-binding PucR family transcriptional regulator [Microbacterium amylolyticum]